MAETSLTRTKPDGLAGRAFLQIQEQELTDAAVEVFTGVIGGRRALAEILSCADDPRIADALSLLAEEHGHGREPMAVREICRRCNLTVADLYRSFLDATALMAKVRAAPHVAKRLAATTAEVMDRAVTRTVVCTRCKGCGTITITPRPTKAQPDPQPEILPCDRCDGYGEVTVEGDLERQRMALQMGGLLKQPGGVAVQNTNTVNLPPPTPMRSYEQEQADLESWLKQDAAAAPVVEAEVVRPVEEPAP